MACRCSGTATHRTYTTTPPGTLTFRRLVFARLLAFRFLLTITWQFFFFPPSSPFSLFTQLLLDTSSSYPSTKVVPCSPLVPLGCIRLPRPTSSQQSLSAFLPFVSVVWPASTLPSHPPGSTTSTSSILLCFARHCPCYHYSSSLILLLPSSSHTQLDSPTSYLLAAELTRCCASRPPVAAPRFTTSTRSSTFHLHPGHNFAVLSAPRSFFGVVVVLVASSTILISLPGLAVDFECALVPRRNPTFNNTSSLEEALHCPGVFV